MSLFFQVENGIAFNLIIALMLLTSRDSPLRLPGPNVHQHDPLRLTIHHQMGDLSKEEINSLLESH